MYWEGTVLANPMHTPRSPIRRYADVVVGRGGGGELVDEYYFFCFFPSNSVGPGKPRSLYLILSDCCTVLRILGTVY